jgi:hypothetical protein
MWLFIFTTEAQRKYGIETFQTHLHFIFFAELKNIRTFVQQKKRTMNFSMLQHHHHSIAQAS